jgi:hypothetical protein
MKIHKPENAETISVLLTPEKFPLAYKEKVDELMEQGAFNTRKEAELWVRTMPIEIELYYEKHCGLFAVESEALESPGVKSPYSGEEMEDEEE